MIHVTGYPNVNLSPGMKANIFEGATEGQTEFDVAPAVMTCSDHYLALIDWAPVSHAVVTRVGNRFTTPPLSEGQVLAIYN